MYMTILRPRLRLYGIWSQGREGDHLDQIVVPVRDSSLLETEVVRELYHVGNSSAF